MSQDPNTPPSTSAVGRSHAREIVSLALVEAVGSSFTPFVPVPFVDDYLFGRLLRRIAIKVVERRGASGGLASLDKPIAKAIVAGYLRAGDSGLGEKAVTAAARFVVRKVAVVLDVKKSHDVFGEAIAFALAIDIAHGLSAIHAHTALSLGGAIHRALGGVGSQAIEVLTRAGREAFKASEGAAESSRFARVAEALGKQVDALRARLDDLLRWELTQPPRP